MARRSATRPSPAKLVRAKKQKSSLITKRLPFDQRRLLIVKKAAEFFAESGFGATTRELALHLGTTQPLLYKYFKGKEDLIGEVYKSVFLDVWDDCWDELLVDRSRPIEDRLIDFYVRYTEVIMNRSWMRVYLFAGLKNVGITSSYIRLVEERVIRRIAIEICAAKGVTLTKLNQARYIEIAWSLQGSIFYYGVRKHAYGLDPHVDKNGLIEDAVRIYVKAWPTADASAGESVRRAS
jgi:AcrR family transcriptional regulator